MYKKALTALSLVATSSVLSAAVVNIDINGGGNVSTPYSGQGAYASAGEHGVGLLLVHVIDHMDPLTWSFGISSAAQSYSEYYNYSD